MHACMQAPKHTHTHTRTWTNTCTHTHACTHTCTHSHISTRAHTDTHSYTNTHGCVRECTGITLSPKQVERGTELAKEQGVPNASFEVSHLFSYLVRRICASIKSLFPSCSIVHSAFVILIVQAFFMTEGGSSDAAHLVRAPQPVPACS